MNEIEVGGLRIAYARSGEGPPLVLLPGILTDSRGCVGHLSNVEAADRFNAEVRSFLRPLRP